MMLPKQTSSTSCQEDSEVSAHIPWRREWVTLPSAFFPAACGIMWLPMYVCVCPLTTRVHVGIVKASCACSLMWLLVPLFPIRVLMQRRGVGADIADTQGGVKGENEGFAKEACTLIKLISYPLSLCVAATTMVLGCAHVCSSLLWSTLLLSRQHVYLYIN